MSRYEYECPNCGVFEIRRSIKADPLKKCPKCGSEIRQLFSPPSAIYRGSGFFTTDKKGDTRVRSASGQLGQRASEIDSSNMDSFSRQRSDSKGRAKATPTRPGPKTMEKMARDAEPS